jgi:hypothetical protein
VAEVEPVEFRAKALAIEIPDLVGPGPDNTILLLVVATVAVAVVAVEVAKALVIASMLVALVVVELMPYIMVGNVVQ